MEDNEVRRLLFNILSNDAELMSMLSQDNSHWSQPEGTDKDPKNSIVPVGSYDYSKMQLPIITVQFGDSFALDYHLVETILYIRCYNSSKKSYYDISKILDRVKTLLHRKQLELDKTRFVELIWQLTSSELEDEAYKLPYREARFVLHRV